MREAVTGCSGRSISRFYHTFGLRSNEVLKKLLLMENHLYFRDAPEIYVNIERH